MIRGWCLFRIAALCTALLSISLRTAASHVLGGDIEIHHYDSGKFALRVNIYLNCKATVNFNPGAINVKAAAGGYNRSAGSEVHGGEDITPVCKNECSPCSSSSCMNPYGF